MLAFCKTVYNPTLGCDHSIVTVDDYKVMQDYLGWRKERNQFRRD
jgi:hypothetical protein